MFALFVSYNCGISYGKEAEAETIEELRPKMKKLDEMMFRWYLEKDGEDYFEDVCSIHKGIIETLTRLNSTKESR